jgi:hypothetical protein
MMQTIRQRLSIFLFYPILFITCALAQSTLSQIQDTVTNPNGTLFNGTAVITWTSSSNPTGGSPTPYNTSVKIYNGALSVLLVPSTTVSPLGYYQVVYSSSNGLVTWTETWQVPPSATPLTLSQIRVTNPGGGGSGGGGGSSVTIAQVTGLSSYLTALNSALVALTSVVNSLNSTTANIGNSLTNLTNQVNNLNSGTTTAVFVENETPNGTINGVNAIFTLANTPGSATTMMLYRNGVLQANGVDYTVSGANITFAGGEIPQAGDILRAYYRVPGTGPLTSFVEAETPQGTIDGANLTFTLASTPAFAASVKLFKNGLLLQQGGDYTLSGATITFASASLTPQPGDTLCAYYRTTN